MSFSEWPDQVGHERPVVPCNQTRFRCNNSASRAYLIPGKLPLGVLDCRGFLRVQSDWASVQCLPHGKLTSVGHTVAVNALTQELFAHANMFLSFTPATLEQPKETNIKQDLLTDFLGNMYPVELFCNHAYRAHA